MYINGLAMYLYSHHFLPECFKNANPDLLDEMRLHRRQKPPNPPPTTGMLESKTRREL